MTHDQFLNDTDTFLLFALPRVDRETELYDTLQLAIKLRDTACKAIEQRDEALRESGNASDRLRKTKRDNAEPTGHAHLHRLYQACVKLRAATEDGLGDESLAAENYHEKLDAAMKSERGKA